MKKFRRSAVALLLTLLMVFALCACTPKQTVTVYTYEIISPEEAEVVDFHTELWQTYLAGDYNNVSAYANGSRELSRPNPVKLAWKGDDSLGYFVQLSTSADFENCDTFVTAKTEISVYNLYSATKYYWRISPEPGALDWATVYTFSTAKVPATSTLTAFPT